MSKDDSAHEHVSGKIVAAVQDGGSGDLGDSIMSSYEVARLHDPMIGMVIQTGIPEFDDRHVVLRRHHITGILGAPSHGKTSLARFFAYSAAAQGLRVVHIALGANRESEEIAYKVLHSRFVHPTLRTITLEKIKLGKLEVHEKHFFETKVMSSYSAHFASKISVHAPDRGCTWSEVRGIIESENAKESIGFVVLDNIEVLQPGNFAGMENVLQDAHGLALNINDRRGLSIVIPITGREDGCRRAAQNNGEWDQFGIPSNFEMASSIKTWVYISRNTELDALHLVKLGAFRLLYEPEIPPISISVDHIARL